MEFTLTMGKHLQARELLFVRSSQLCDSHIWKVLRGREEEESQLPINPSCENSRIIHSSDGCCRAKFFIVLRQFGLATMSSSSCKGKRKLSTCNKNTCLFQSLRCTTFNTEGRRRWFWQREFIVETYTSNLVQQAKGILTPTLCESPPLPFLGKILQPVWPKGTLTAVLGKLQLIHDSRGTATFLGIRPGSIVKLFCSVAPQAGKFQSEPSLPQPHAAHNVELMCFVFRRLYLTLQ